MSEENKYEIEDLINSAVLQKPTEFEDAFNDLIVDRIRNAIETKRTEIAQQLYNYEPEQFENEIELEYSGEEENG